MKSLETKTLLKNNIEDSKSVIPPLMSWDSIKWKNLENHVFGVQQRIFHAERNGQFRKVRDLQRLLLRSKSALLVSIRIVTQLNKGKRTAGIDGYKALTPQERVDLYNKLKDYKFSLHNPNPVKRTYIEKKNGKLRPLGIPTIIDRIYQNIVKMALEPQWEAKFEPSSYGFRPKRSTHDAIENIYKRMVKGNKQWVFEGDFKGCFDNLNHEYILKQLENFPAKELIAKWLKVGYIDNNIFHKTENGTPQGGIISPLLANIALHGMEEEIGIKYTKIIRKRDGITYDNKTPYSMVRYADDFVIMCENKEDAESMYNKLQPYLKARGLQLEETKTKIVHITEGFDFLGFNIRRYEVQQGSKLLIKPSKESIKKCKAKISEVFEKNNGSNANSLISNLNPVIRGYGNYWSSVVSKDTFRKIDYYIFGKIVKFMKRLHPMKSWKWKKERYFKPDKTGQSETTWLFTDPQSNIQIINMIWTPIVRHVMIKHDSSPYNKELKEYYSKRDIREFNKNNVAYRQKLAKKQKYLCPFCKESIVDGKESLEMHHKIPRCNGGSDDYKNLQLVHTSCHIFHHKIFPARKHLPIPTKKDMNIINKRLKEERQKDTWKLYKNKSKLD